MTTFFGTMLLATTEVMFICARAAAATLEDVSPHFPINAPIVWCIPTNALSASFWVYRKLPHVYSAATISNAVVLASFQSKGFPKPSKRAFVLWADHFDGEPRPPYLRIAPEEGTISYSVGDRWRESPEEILKDQFAVERAWDCLNRLGIDRTQFAKRNVGTYGVFFPRQIDGVLFDESEGFEFQQYGSERKLRSFNLVLPDLQRTTNSRTANPHEIIACIRAFKTPLAPDSEGPNYFERVKSLSEARKVNITNITPYYSEGTFGEVPTNNEPSKFVTPIALLEGTVDFGNSNTVVRLFSPIISSEVVRVLGGKSGDLQKGKRP